MMEEQLLKMLIKSILNEENTKLRSAKGYGASHPVINRKPFMMGLGKSEYEEVPKKKKAKKKDVKISKAFDIDELEEYESILEGILDAKDLY